MQFDEEELKILKQDTSETKRNILIVLFSSTLLLFWWLGDLIFPIFIERSPNQNLLLIITITVIPLFVNMFAWFVWGVIGKKFGVDYSIHFEVRNRDPFERIESAYMELYKHKRIERLIQSLAAIQFIIMGALLIVGFLNIRIGLA